MRWLVLGSLMFAIYRAYSGISLKRVYSKIDDSIRHWTATIAHIQLVLGIVLYTQSSVVKYFWNDFKSAFYNLDSTFFGLLHISLMLTAIVFITVGSALSKRGTTDEGKFKTMLFWFFLSLVIIFMAIPWPFSPLVSRPYFR
jgi:hypothetical protein